MFVVGVVAAGGIIFVYDDHSKHSNYSDYGDYSAHSNHSAHSRYGDSAVRQDIADYENRIGRKENEVNGLRSDYQNLAHYDIGEVKAQQKRELEAEIANETAELARIDAMIAKINELELQAKGA